MVESSDPNKIKKYVEGRRRIGERRLKRIINMAQSMGEELAVLSRRQAVNYDQILRVQRELMYLTRDRLLEGGDIDEKRLLEIAQRNIRRFIRGRKSLTAQSVNRYLLDHISYRLDGETHSLVLVDPDKGKNI